MHTLSTKTKSHLLNACSSHPRSPPLNLPPRNVPSSGKKGGGLLSFSLLLSGLPFSCTSPFAPSLQSPPFVGTVSSSITNSPLFRLNQLPPLFFGLSCGLALEGTDDPFVDARLGDDGRLLPVVGYVSFDCLGRLSDVRELLNEERRFVRLSSRRTPFGLFCACVGEEEYRAADAGDVGVRKLSARSGEDITPDFGSSFLSCSKYVAGWLFSGPRPGVGGSMGDFGGVERGAGIFVPVVMGSMARRCDFRLLWVLAAAIA